MIWGTVLYKLFFDKFREQELPDEIVVTAKSNSFSSGQDTFSIVANYRDPFLGNVTASENHGNNSIIKKPAILPIEDIVLQWPTLIYGGMIKNQQSSKQLALVKVNGKEIILKEGEMAGSVEIVKIFKDSVEVRMGKAVKVIRK